jgi:nuclear GTP-binding protein
MTYNVPAFPTGPEGCMTFLAMVARSKGRVLKGGIPDKIMAGRLVIKDWNQGKIPYYSMPPNDKIDATASSVGGAKIMNQFSEKFDINKILEDHDNELMQELDDVDEMDFVQMNSVPRDAVDANKVLNYLTKEGSDDEDSDAMEEDGAHVNAQMQDAEDFEFDS